MEYITIIFELLEVSLKFKHTDGQGLQSPKTSFPMLFVLQYGVNFLMIPNPLTIWSFNVWYKVNDKIE